MNVPEWVFAAAKLPDRKRLDKDGLRRFAITRTLPPKQERALGV